MSPILIDIIYDPWSHNLIILPIYLDMFLLNALRDAIEQIRVSSHQLEIENGRANEVSREEKVCRLCHLEIDDQYHLFVSI